MRDINSMSRRECLGPKQAQLNTMHTAQLGLPDKGRAIKGMVVCNNWDLETFGPSKRSGPRLLSAVP